MTHVDSILRTWKQRWADHSRWLRLIVVLTLLTALILTWTKGARHDYEHHYLPSWQVAMSGGDPWQTGGSDNAYGPGFLLLAPLAALHPLLPKYLLMLCWFGLAAWYFRSLPRDPRDGSFGTLPGRRRPSEPEADQFPERREQGTGTWLVAFFFLNPLFWIEIPIYGHVDILLACICVAALHQYCAGHPIKAASLLAVGSLLKFYPAVLFILFTLQRRRSDLKFAGAFLVLSSLGMGLAYVMWGTSVLDPILWADERPSKLLSVFRYLRGAFSLTPDLDRLAGPCTLIATTVVIWYCRRHRLALPLASFATLLALFTFYKVGHVQYQVVLFGLFPYLWLDYRQLFRRHRPLRLATVAYLGWIVLFQWLYYLGGELNQMPWSHLRELAGLVTFPLALWLLVTLLRSGRQVRS